MNEYNITVRTLLHRLEQAIARGDVTMDTPVVITMNDPRANETPETFDPDARHFDYINDNARHADVNDDGTFGIWNEPMLGDPTNDE